MGYNINRGVEVTSAYTITDPSIGSDIKKKKKKKKKVSRYEG